MSMLSVHFLIVNEQRRYWTGAHEDNPFAWGEYGKAVRFHDEASARAVREGALCFVKNLRIVEDE